MSDRLDIVRLIDAKVTSSRRIVTRSKQLAEAARGELHVHEDWIRQHREGYEVDLRRHRRRLKRRERIENNKRFAMSALLFLPRLCGRLCRGTVSGLRKVDNVVFSGCARLGEAACTSGRSLGGVLAGSAGPLSRATVSGLRKLDSAVSSGCARLGEAACASGRSLGKVIAAGTSRIGEGILALGLVLAAAAWLTLSSMAKAAYIVGLALARATARCLSRVAPEISRFGEWLTASLTPVPSRLAVAYSGGVPQPQASRLPTRLRRKARAPARERAEPALDPRPLQHAAFVRLRAEHERLQARIYAMDRRHEQRAPTLRDRDAREWVELRRLALNAQRLFDAQQRQVLGPAARRGNGASALPANAPARAPTHPLRAAHAIYDAPAPLPGHRRG